MGQIGEEYVHLQENTTGDSHTHHVVAILLYEG